MENKFIPRRPQPLTFSRGRHFYQIGKASDGSGYVGILDGRRIASGTAKAEVVRAMLSATADQ